MWMQSGFFKSSGGEAASVEKVEEEGEEEERENIKKGRAIPGDVEGISNAHVHSIKSENLNREDKKFLDPYADKACADRSASSALG